MAPKRGRPAKETNPQAQHEIIGQSNPIVGQTASASEPPRPATPDLNVSFAQAFQNFLTQLQTSSPATTMMNEERPISLDKGSLFDKFLKANLPDLSKPNNAAAAKVYLKKIEKSLPYLDARMSRR